MITNESVRCLLEDEDGTILIGTTAYGLMRYSPSTGEVSRAFKDILSGDLCLTLYRDSKKRIVGWNVFEWILLHRWKKCEILQ